MANKKTNRQKRPSTPFSRFMLKLKHIFIPHKGNNYHPHLIRKHGLIMVLTAALIGQLGYTYVTTGKIGILGRVTDVTVSGLLTQTNQARQTDNLTPLKLNTKLSQAAYAKAQDMIANNYWSHTSPTGVQPWKWFSDYGYSYDSAGENLAKNYPTSSDVVNAWLDSPTHRENVLNGKYSDVGFAVVDGQIDGKDTSLVVAMYAQPTVGAVLASSDTPINSGSQFQSPQAVDQSPINKFGSTIQNLNPAALGSLVLFMASFLVAMLTYANRKKLPKQIRKAWYAHHSLYKAGSFAILAITIVVLGSGGQI